MCNEEMALQIQQGNKELLPQLWDNLYKLIYKYANSFYINYYDRCSSVGILLDGLLQEGYFAMLSSIEAYKPESGYKLTAYLRFPLKNQFASIVGLRSKQKGNDALNKAVSLDTTVDDDGDIFLGNTIEDAKAQGELNRVITDVYIQLLHNALEESMEDLKDIQKDFIKLLYYENIYITRPCDFKTSRNIGLGSRKEVVLKEYNNEINNEESGLESSSLVAGTVYGGVIFEFENDFVSSIIIGAIAE